ncbi:MAG: FtsX-like permease family protein, partial [Gammaproteobacteria bacterium]
MDRRGIVASFRIVGVVDTWTPTPKFYDLTTGPFDETEEVYLPFNLIPELELSRSGNTSCWKPWDGTTYREFLNSECIWVQFWAELRSAEEKRAYQASLDNYVSAQKELGRFPRPLNNRLSNVMEWMETQEVVMDEARILLAVAIMFLAVCLLNTLGLLLAKFLGKAPEIGLRRALGASKRKLFTQYLVESGCIGVAGGAAGLVIAWGGL